MSTIDASQCWRIMPFPRPEAKTEWWILGPDSQPVFTGIHTKERAFAMALEHNKAYGVNAVYVHGVNMKKGKWEQPPAETQITEESIREIGDKAMQDVLQQLKKEQNPNDDITEQMDKDFEDYKKLMAAGAYPEAEQVERSVREMKQRNPDMPEEFMWKLAVSAIAARKRLNKEFFPVDHNEDPPTPETVAILLKCWHIMPLVRDEDEGEKWWILGPNNKASQEASTAGPFKTRKEAFWIALEHNRTLGVNAVYVHGREKDGEIGDGDFEEPSEEDFDDDEPAEQPTLEQSIMEVGDQAMKTLLRELEEEQTAKRSRLSKLITIIKNGVVIVFTHIFSAVILLIVFGMPVIIPTIIRMVMHHSTASTETDEKNDCVIVATEAYQRLRAEGVWAEVIGLNLHTPKGETFGHAMCVYQPEKTGNLWVYDSNGSWQLAVRSADLRVVEWAFNQSLTHGYSATDFKVLVQEPAKAKPANQLTKR
jgi:hypothetical protein